MFAVPFTEVEFLGVFAAYNRAVWPAQIVLVVTAGLAIAATFRRTPRADRWISAFLAALWLWTGVMYHLVRFTTINPAAFAFGVLFLLQAAGFLWWGSARHRLVFRPERNARGAVAAAILAYALIIYPLIGFLQGRAWLESPTFGAPCPAVMYTFGMLLLARPAPVRLVIVPLLWAVVGGSAAFAFGMPQDAGLPASALLVIALDLRARRASGLSQVRPARVA